MNRIVTNIIELDKLYKRPPEEWCNEFVDGKLDIYEEIKDHPFADQILRTIHENSNYDVIGWMIENDCFDWENNSWVVAECCPERLDPKKFNWEDASWAVARCCPHLLDPKLFNWKKYSFAVAESCPDKIVPELYNWKDDSWAVAMFCPDKIDPKRFNWEKDLDYVMLRCPEKIELLRYCGKFVKVLLFDSWFEKERVSEKIDPIKETVNQ